MDHACCGCLPPPDTDLHLLARRPELADLPAVGAVLFQEGLGAA